MSTPKIVETPVLQARNDVYSASSQSTSSTRSYYRSPFRSPARARSTDDLLRDLSPTTILQAFNNVDATGALRASIDAATPAQRAYAIRAAEASKNVLEWVDELSAWPWPKPPAGFEPSIEHGNNQVQADTAKEEYWGSLLVEQVLQYEARIDEISQDLDSLDVPDLQSIYRENHLLPNATPGRYNKLDDLTAVITATLLHIAPAQSKLDELTNVWTLRLTILRQIPSLLDALVDAESELESAWQYIHGTPSRSPQSPGSNEAPISTLTRSTFDSVKRRLASKIVPLAQQVDFILDSLAGQVDTLPESWPARMDAIEKDFVEWTADAEVMVFVGERYDDEKSHLCTQVDGPAMSTHLMDELDMVDVSKSQIPRPSTPIEAIPTADCFRTHPKVSHDLDKEKHELHTSVLPIGAMMSTIESIPLRTATPPDTSSDDATNEQVPKTPRYRSPSLESIAHALRSPSNQPFADRYLEDGGSPRSPRKTPRSGNKFTDGFLLSKSPLSPPVPFPTAEISSIFHNRNMTLVQPTMSSLDTANPLDLTHEKAVLPASTSHESARDPEKSSNRSVPLVSGSCLPTTPHSSRHTADGVVPSSISNEHGESNSSSKKVKEQVQSILANLPGHITLSNVNKTRHLDSNNSTDTPTQVSVTKSRSKTTKSRPSSRASTPTPAFTLTPAHEATKSRPKNNSGNSEIHQYHLSRTQDEAPVKLLLRLVGDHERVMVRVGGGWADLGEYLKEYATHHGTAVASNVDVQRSITPTRRVSGASIPSRSSPSVNRPLSSMGVEKAGNLGPATPLRKKKSRIHLSAVFDTALDTSVDQVREPTKPSTPIVSSPEQTRYSPERTRHYTRSSTRTSMNDDIAVDGCHSPEYGRSKHRRISAISGSRQAATSSRSSSSSRPASRAYSASPQEELGLAGPTGRNVAISKEKLDWVETMKDKILSASAEKEEVIQKKEFGSLGKAGATRRLFFKDLH